MDFGTILMRGPTSDAPDLPRRPECLPHVVIPLDPSPSEAPPRGRWVRVLGELGVTRHVARIEERDGFMLVGADLFGFIDLKTLRSELDRLDAQDPPFDQASFLLHDQGRSKREAVYFWWGTELMACRMREYKVHVKVVLPQTTHMHIDMATIQNVGLAPWLFNLYIDPKEAMPVGHRRNAWLATVTAKLRSHGATFREYPPKQIGLGMEMK